MYTLHAYIHKMYTLHTYMHICMDICIYTPSEETGCDTGSIL